MRPEREGIAAEIDDAVAHGDLPRLEETPLLRPAVGGGPDEVGDLGAAALGCPGAAVALGGEGFEALGGDLLPVVDAVFVEEPVHVDDAVVGEDGGGDGVGLDFRVAGSVVVVCVIRKCESVFIRECESVAIRFSECDVRRIPADNALDDPPDVVVGWDLLARLGGAEDPVEDLVFGDAAGAEGGGVLEQRGVLGALADGGRKAEAALRGGLAALGGGDEGDEPVGGGGEQRPGGGLVEVEPLVDVPAGVNGRRRDDVAPGTADVDAGVDLAGAVADARVRREGVEQVAALRGDGGERVG